MAVTKNSQELISASRQRGWVLEPDAKQILSDAGLQVPEFRMATTMEDALRCADEIGYPLVAKIVSPNALHKSDVGGVEVGVRDKQHLEDIFYRWRTFDGFMGVHIEAMASGLELIVGAKIDPQFGPVILLGIGGTSVEIYQDIAIRMAPLEAKDVASMVAALKAKRLLEGYRGTAPINMDQLTQTLMVFSILVMEIADEIESIDLNPVMCTEKACIVADARIILRT
jgi:acyl-CoA synthetase (NDP forming)